MMAKKCLRLEALHVRVLNIQSESVDGIIQNCPNLKKCTVFPFFPTSTQSFIQYALPSSLLNQAECTVHCSIGGAIMRSREGRLEEFYINFNPILFGSAPQSGIHLSLEHVPSLRVDREVSLTDYLVKLFVEHILQSAKNLKFQQRQSALESFDRNPPCID